jgi:hypothetical protein
MKKEKREQDLVYFSLDLMKIHIEISRKVKPAMPLTSLDESNMPSGLNVVNTPSPNNITANIKTRNPKTASSVFMDISHPLNRNRTLPILHLFVSSICGSLSFDELNHKKVQSIFN